MIEVRRTAGEFGFGEGRALADRHRRQVDPVGDIAHRPDAVDIGFRKFVDDHRAALAERHSGLLQSQSGGVGRPAGGEQNLVVLQGMTVGKMADDAALGLL